MKLAAMQFNEMNKRNRPEIYKRPKSGKPLVRRITDNGFYTAL